MPNPIPAKQIDSPGVLNTKKVIMGVRFESFITSAASSDSSDALNKEFFDASLSKKLGGSTSAEGIIDASSPLNVAQLRDNATGDPIENGSNEQIFGEVTSSVSALSDTYEWDGTTTVTASGTPGDLVAGEWIKNDADGQYFEVASVVTTTITILNPDSLIIPDTSASSDPASKADLTLSYYTISGGVKTAHTFGAAADIDVKFPESHGFDNTRFADMRLDRFGGFNEVLPRDSFTDIGSGNPNTTSGAVDIGTDASAIGASAGSTDTVQGVLEAFGSSLDGLDDIGSGNPNTTSGAALVGTDASAIGPNAGSTDTIQGVLEAFDTAITAAASSGDTPNQELVTTQAITGTDTAITDTLNATPLSAASVALFLNGVQQIQGAGEDYTISGTTITWLASSGTAVDLEATDKLVAYYMS